MKDISELEKIVVIRQHILEMWICTSIPPEEKESINAELITAGLNVSGTKAGWVLDENEQPVKCNDYEGRWHYRCLC